MKSLVSLKSFSVFPEYFITFSLLYLLIVVSLLVYSSRVLILQKSVSESIALILFMSCYLLLNDDLITLNYLSFNNSIVNDYLSFLTKFILCFFAGLYFLVISEFLQEQKIITFEYLIIALFSTLGLLVMCSSNDLLITYLALELSSLALYLLASFKKTSTYSIESGIKYFIIGAISSAFFLLGSSILYGISGSINFQDFHYLFRNLHFMAFRSYYWNEHNSMYILLYLILEDYGLPTLAQFQSSLIEIGLVLILFSLFIKLSLAPFHLWSLDVYEGSPTSSSIFFAVITKLSIFVVLVRLCYACFYTLSDSWQFYFCTIGILSIFAGSFGGLQQRKLKTLLAYSSISHMGYIILIIATGFAFSVHLFLFYMIAYMFSSLIIWSLLLFLRLKFKSVSSKFSKNIGDLALLSKSNSSLALVFLITLFSLAGLPPLLGFITKFGVFLPLIRGHYNGVALLSILLTIVSTFYYIRLIKIIYFENILVGQLYYPINTEKTLIISILTLLLIFCFLNPTLLYLICCKIIFIS